MPSVVYIGASRGIGFEAYRDLALSRKDVKSFLLLRSVETFKNNDSFKALDADAISRTELVSGDAHDAASVKNVLTLAGEDLDTIIFSIGQAPPTSTLVILREAFKGFPLETPDICTRGLIILLKVLSELPEALISRVKLVVGSSMGIGEAAHKTLPFGLKWFYGSMLKSSHEDKLAMEVVISQVLLPEPQSTLPRFFPAITELDPKILPETSLASLPKPFLRPQNVCVIRMALLTDDKARGWGKYRVEQEGAMKGAYTISRGDAGGFVAKLVEGKDEDATKWWGTQPVLAY